MDELHFDTNTSLVTLFDIRKRSSHQVEKKELINMVISVWFGFLSTDNKPIG